MTDRIEFQLDEEAITFVEELGLDPNEFACQLFEREVRRLRTEKRHERLEEAEITLPRSAADLIREDRER